jgi:hypothetical protein
MTETKTTFENWTSTFFSHIRDKVCQPKGDEVTGEWIKLHNGELNGLYSSPNILWVIKSRRMRWSEHVVRMGECRGAQKVLVGKPGGKRTLGRTRRRWEDNIKMNLQEVGCGGMGLIDLSQDRNNWGAVVNPLTNRGFRKMRGIS